MIASIISFGFGTFGDPDHIVTHGFVSGIGGGGEVAAQTTLWLRLLRRRKYYR